MLVLGVVVGEVRVVVGADRTGDSGEVGEDTEAADDSKEKAGGVRKW